MHTYEFRINVLRNLKCYHTYTYICACILNTYVPTYTGIKAKVKRNNPLVWNLDALHL